MHFPEYFKSSRRSLTYLTHPVLVFIVILIPVVEVGFTSSPSSSEHVFTAIPTTSPSLSAIELQLKELLSISLSCLPPCWWGKELGDAELREYQIILEEAFAESLFYETYLDTYRFEILGINDLPYSPLQIKFVESSNEINHLSLFYYGHDFSLNAYSNPMKVVQSFGRPSRILISQSQTGASIIILYDSNNLALTYSYQPSFLNHHDTNCQGSLFTLILVEINSFSNNNDGSELYLEFKDAIGETYSELPYTSLLTQLQCMPPIK
jgi:hypothetical protein